MAGRSYHALMWLLFVVLTLLSAAVANIGISWWYGTSPAQLVTSPAFRYATAVIAVPALTVGALALAIGDDVVYGAVGACVAALPSLVYVWRSRRQTARILSLDPAEADQIVADIKRSRPPAGTPSLRFELSVVLTARQLVSIARYDAAEEILALLPWAELEPTTMVPAALLRATCYLNSNLIGPARDTLEVARPHADATGESDPFAILDARLSVHEGEVTRVLARMDDLDAIVARDPRYRADRDIIQIHAAAACGERARALALIGSLREEHESGWLTMLSFPQGPASPLAETLSSRGAYR